MAVIEDLQTIREILKDSRTVAVVGISPKPERASHYVSQWVLERGLHKVYFVNPVYAGRKILGREVLPSLRDIPEGVDIVDVFRKPSALEEIVVEAINIGAKYVWLQPGTENEEVIEKYKDKIDFIKTACLGVVVKTI
ncbi:MAG TPA: CoA-binding protein [Aquifex aeolicus]|nr:CoA-binding protein [Aquificales bacterium]HIP86739.1 CoA-binding protein [Aquifex sp.]HIQ26194.1 CoA-binding protein [Aquifex aeolicus]